MPAFLKGALRAIFLALNTIGTFSLMIPASLIKLVTPAGSSVRSLCDRVLNALASGWVARNNVVICNPQAAQWQVEGMDQLSPKAWYLVLPNHRSWVDILLLQRSFHGHIPFLKFFLKQSLIYVPVIGLAWWALDFPFMKRGKGRSSRASDMAATRKACERFRHLPTTVINFVEGTRFTAAKHLQQSSPYKHLLKPRLGALGVALTAMGDQFTSALSVTLVYPEGTPSFWQLLCGQVRQVKVLVHTELIPEILRGDGDPEGQERRQALQAWMQQMWQAMDERIERALQTS